MALQSYDAIYRYSVDQGTLLISPGSHTSDQLAGLRDGYGRTQVGADGVASGWISDDPNTINKQVLRHYMIDD